MPSAARAGLVLEPAPDLSIDAGNEFDPEALHSVRSLSNTGPEDAPWQVSASQPWVRIAGPTGGTLAPGQSVDVAIDVDPSAALASGANAASAEVTVVDPRTAVVVGQQNVNVGGGFGGRSAGGWTQFTPSVDTRMVYVSRNSGNDQNDGLSDVTPKRTVAAGIALLRHGYPDWLLLERGNVWQESLGQWKKSGRSQAEPMLIATYGAAAARPRLDTGIGNGIWTNGGGGSPASIDNLAVTGIHFRPDAYTGAGICIGAQMLQPSTGLLIEDCKFEGYTLNLVLQGYGGRHRDFTVRRSVIVDAYAIHSIGGHSQGLYAYAVDGLLLEENVFDHNGWNASVPGAGADIFSHNIYIDNDNTSVFVRGNLISNASSHGMQLRPGGVVTNNVFVRNSIALSVGGGNNPEQNGVQCFVRGNVIIDGKNIDAATPRGWGMWFANIASGQVTRNLIANNVLGGQPNMITLAGNHVGDNWPSIGVHNLTIDHNVLYDWAGGVNIEGDSWKISNVVLDHNDVQNHVSSDNLIAHDTTSSTSSVNSSANRFYSQLAPAGAWTTIGSQPCALTTWFGQVGDASSTAQSVAYGAPTRSPATYDALLGGAGTLNAFLQQARSQSSTSWRNEYMAATFARYMRGGF